MKVKVDAFSDRGVQVGDQFLEVSAMLRPDGVLHITCFVLFQYCQLNIPLIVLGVSRGD